VSVLLHGIHQNVPTTWRPGAFKVQIDAGHGRLRGPHGEYARLVHLAGWPGVAVSITVRASRWRAHLGNLASPVAALSSGISTKSRVVHCVPWKQRYHCPKHDFQAYLEDQREMPVLSDCRRARGFCVQNPRIAASEVLPSMKCFSKSMSQVAGKPRHLTAGLCCVRSVDATRLCSTFKESTMRLKAIVMILCQALVREVEVKVEVVVSWSCRRRLLAAETTFHLT
jgi:hypothetical protein